MNLPDKIKKLQEENPLGSMADIVSKLDNVEQAMLFDGFTEDDFKRLEYDADFWLRPKQKIPTQGGEWFITALISGRGFG